MFNLCLSMFSSEKAICTSSREQCRAPPLLRKMYKPLCYEDTFSLLFEFKLVCFCFSGNWLWRLKLLFRNILFGCTLSECTYLSLGVIVSRQKGMTSLWNVTDSDAGTGNKQMITRIKKHMQSSWKASTVGSSTAITPTERRMRE